MGGETYIGGLDASLRWHDSKSTLQRIPPHNISRRTIATDQEIVAGIAGHRAADPQAGWPDDLGIMGDIAPGAGGAVVREQSALEIAVLVDPGADHFPVTISIAGTHPQIFALPRVAAGLRIMGEFPGAGQRSGIDGGVLRQFRVPDQFRRADLGPRFIMRPHHCILQPAFAARFGLHARTGFNHRGRCRIVRRPGRAGGKDWRD